MEEQKLDELLKLLKQYQSYLLMKSQNVADYKIGYRTRFIDEIKDIQYIIYRLEQELDLELDLELD